MVAVVPNSFFEGRIHFMEIAKKHKIFYSLNPFVAVAANGFFCDKTISPRFFYFVMREIYFNTFLTYIVI